MQRKMQEKRERWPGGEKEEDRKEGVVEQEELELAGLETEEEVEQDEKTWENVGEDGH